MEQPASNRNRNIAIGVGLGLLVVCCACLVALGGVGYFGYQFMQSSEIAPLLTQISVTDTPTDVPHVVLTPLPSPVPGAGETLAVLESAVVPQADRRLLTMRLKGIADIPEVVSTTAANHQIGDKVDFRAGDDATQTYFTIHAALVYRRENVYFFAEDGLSVNKADVKRLVDAFQDKMYPTDREFFGSEWSPGVDGDPALYVLYARGLGSNVAGYYSSADEYSHLAYARSNEKEMFYVNADAVTPGEDYVYSTLAHEFQHMIHWYHDRNEESWMNEGASELAAFLNGYDVGGADYSFAANPDLQLTAWSDSTSPEFSAHYGAAFLFMAYFLDRFGPETTKELVAAPENGMQAVEAVLRTAAVSDALSGQPVTANDVFGDWVIANYLNDASVGDGRYAYHNYPQAPTTSFPTDTITDCPTAQSATVRQFGADYYAIQCAGDHTLNFTGSQQVQLIPAEPHSGRYAFWSNREDESDTTLTRAFDLSGLKTATLNYWMWAQIEKNFDYAYVEVSTDAGQTWQMLHTPSGTDTDPTSANLGWGYTGNSGGGDPGDGDPAEWIEESVDLSPYAGQKIMLRFEYVTDAALNYASLLLDDISIPELNYASDFETDAGGWDGQGFVRIDNLLAQQFVVQVIHQGGQTTVERMSLDSANQGSLKLKLENGETATLVVSGLTPFTTQPASYQFEIK